MPTTVPRPARALAFAQLLRLPNVFTAFADIALAGCATGLVTAQPGVFLLLCLSSGCLYLGGMVWNDFFDHAEDAKTQAFRPIPSGRVSVRTAAILASGLLFTGGFLASLVRPGDGWPTPSTVAAALIFAILLYDGWLKHTPLGPVAMGLCRSLNVLLGLSATPDAVPETVLWLLPVVTGTYIVGVTWFARTEEKESHRKTLVAACGVIGLSLAMALYLRSRVPSDPGAVGQFLFPYLLVAFGFFIGLPLNRAVRKPGPKEVQAAVKRCVLGLVALDAVLATAFVGAPGLIVLLLLPPALALGKWVYST